ncbi:MAG: NUDIX hydrolase [Lachnospiraceae bacterium]|nr:NUDIX hydrolase [Lachnospiraceae bacterium]
MGKVDKVEQMTHTPYVNLYELKITNKKGAQGNYYVASRAKNPDALKLSTGKNVPDGVIIYSVYGEKRDRVVLVRQYRYSIGGYIYEFPAGLVEPGEDYHKAGVRELKEETGLSLELLYVDEMFERPGFTTVGMTDESCATVYGYASGAVSCQGQEDGEEIEVVLADRQEVERILREERVAIMCAYMLMHFLKDEDPFAFLNK